MSFSCSFTKSSSPCVPIACPSPQPPLPGYGSDFGSLDVTDLQLLHHYIFETVPTLHGKVSDEHQDVFRKTFVRMGFRTPYVLHAILATAAMHLAALLSNQRRAFLLRGSAHQNAALRTVMPIIASGTLTREQSLDIFAFTCFTAITSLGEARLHASLPGNEADDPIDQIIASLRLMRGVTLVLESHGHYVRSPQSEVAVIFENTHEMAMAADEIKRRSTTLPHVAAFIQSAQNHPGMRNRTDAEKEACIEALKSAAGLVQEFQRTDSDHHQIRCVHRWPFSIREPFLDMLVQRHPISLVVLAHFAVLMHLQDVAWWLTGWGRRLLVKIEQVLGPEFEEALAWPRSMISASAPAVSHTGQLDAATVTRQPAFLFANLQDLEQTASSTNSSTLDG